MVVLWMILPYSCHFEPSVANVHMKNNQSGRFRPLWFVPFLILRKTGKITTASCRFKNPPMRNLSYSPKPVYAQGIGGSTHFSMDFCDSAHIFLDFPIHHSALSTAFQAIFRIFHERHIGSKSRLLPMWRKICI